MSRPWQSSTSRNSCLPYHLRCHGSRMHLHKAPLPPIQAHHRRLAIQTIKARPTRARLSKSAGLGHMESQPSLRVCRSSSAQLIPGLKQYTLKVRVETPQETWRRDPHNLPQQSGEPIEEVIGPDGIPPVHIMLELVSVFMIHFGAQFPCIDRRDLEQKIRFRTGSSFLLNSIAGIAAR